MPKSTRNVRNWAPKSAEMSCKASSVFHVVLGHRALFQMRRVLQIRTLNMLLQPVAQELE